MNGERGLSMHKLTNSPQRGGKDIETQGSQLMPSLLQQALSSAEPSVGGFQTVLDLDGVLQMQKLLAQYDNPAALHQQLRENEHLHTSFLQHAEGLLPEGPPEDLERLLEFSLRHAPLDVLRRFLFAHFLKSMNTDPQASSQLSINSIQRGRFMELLAEESSAQLPAATMFLTGGLSELNALTGIELKDALREFDAPQEVQNALLQDTTDAVQAGVLLQLSRRIEEGDWASCEPLLAVCEISGERAATLYGKAAIWTWMLLG